MRDVPVAQPEPRGPASAPRQAVALTVLAIVLVAVIGVVLAFGWPQSGQLEPAELTWADVGAEDSFPLWQPVRRSLDDPSTLQQLDFYVVRLPDEVLALSTKDPHLGCTVPWRAEFTFMGATGWFRNPCHGETYDLAGACVSGPCVRGLDRYATRLSGGIVQVNVGDLLPGPAERPSQPLNPPSGGSE